MAGEVKAPRNANTLDLRTSGGTSPRLQKRRQWRWRGPRWGRKSWFVVAGVLVVAACAAAAVIFLDPFGLRDEPGDGEAAAKQVKQKVSRHFLLPTDENPALATITDKDKLTSPAFKGTENGDKILIYQKHKMAIVYRPSKDRVVAVLPVSIDEPTNITRMKGQ